MSNTDQAWRERLARWLASRSGTEERAAELRHHLDEAANHGSHVSAFDIGSLILLCLRALRKRVAKELPTTIVLVLGAALLGFGLFVASFPFVSVHRLSNEAIAMLPGRVGAVVEDDVKGATAIFDKETFVLATRTYEDTPVEQIEAALLARGFSVAYGPTPSQNGFGIECCGEYDQLVVQLEQVGDATFSTVTARDSDITISWPILAFLGTAAAVVGIGLITSARKVRSMRSSNPAKAAKPLQT